MLTIKRIFFISLNRVRNIKKLIIEKLNLIINYIFNNVKI